MPHTSTTSPCNDSYKTEAETFQWSFVHEMCLTPKMIELVDHEEGLGRVKESPHWCGVYGACVHPTQSIN